MITETRNLALERFPHLHKYGGQIVASLLIVGLLAGCGDSPTDGPYQATGMKIGEVTDSGAIIWVRLTQSKERVGTGAHVPDTLYIHPDTGALVQDPRWPATPEDWVPVVEYPEGATIDNIEGAVPGTPGEARIGYRAESENEWKFLPWAAVDSQRDFTQQFIIMDLEPATAYEIVTEGRNPGSEAISSSLGGQFKTAPLPDEPARVVFAAVTGQAYPDQDAPNGGFRIYPSILGLEPDFFVHTGDILYYDQWGKTLDLARWGWARMFSLPTNVEFHRQLASYFMKDDHDTLSNDSWPSMQSEFMGEFTFAQGQAVFLEQVPMGERTYRTFRWGQDLQIWMMENRDYRSANTDPDGPEKTIWGAEQKAWFQESFLASDATFRVLISPTPMLGPYNEGEIDNHTNFDGFYHEGEELRTFLGMYDNVIIISGDRHYQYVIEEAETGLREYATGPASDAHARGWNPEDIRPEHRYLNVVGGFLTVTVDRRQGRPTIVVRHYDVDGNILNEDMLATYGE
jgi:alkaline phosphatase D